MTMHYVVKLVHVNMLDLLSTFTKLDKFKVELCSATASRAGPKGALIEKPRVRFQSLSNLTTSFVPLTHIGSVPPHKGICNFKIFQLKCFWQFPRFYFGLVILTVPNGSPWVAVCAQRAFARIQSEFFPTFLDGETSCWSWKDGLLIVLCHAELLDF